MITLDGYAASHRAVAKLKTSGVLPRRVQVRSCKYLNNVIEQDHRRIKQRVRPVLATCCLARPSWSRTTANTLLCSASASIRPVMISRLARVPLGIAPTANLNSRRQRGHDRGMNTGLLLPLLEF